MKKITIALLVMFSLGMMANATGMQGDKKRGGIFKLIKQLDLTVEQKQEFKALKKERKAMMKVKKEERKSNKKAMKIAMQPDLSQFMSANTFDKVAFKKEMNKRFNSMRKKMKKRREEMLEKRANGMEKIFNILTAEQRTKLISLSNAKK
jgi:Spy/CpxP family protein refolding chaperone